MRAGIRLSPGTSALARVGDGAGTSTPHLLMCPMAYCVQSFQEAQVRRSRRIPCVFLLLASVLLLHLSAGEAPAQNATTGVLTGSVVAEDGEGVATARVAALNLATGLRRESLTDASGRFILRVLPPGEYRVEVMSLGWATVVVEPVTVRLGGTSELPVRLAREAIALAGIEVRAERGATLDPWRGGTTQAVSREEIGSLPTLGRDFTDLIALSGMVSPQLQVSTGGQFSIGGGRTSGVNVQIDGADANYNFFGESRGGARIPFAFSLESIREFQVIANGVDVEYGNYSSGIVNAVTRRGTNDFQGSVHGFLRHDALTTREFQRTLALPGGDTIVGGGRPDAFEVRQFGINFSGPIVQNRLHYLASWDAQRRTDPFETATAEGTGAHPDSIARFIDILERVYGQTGAANEFGRFHRTDDVDVLFARLDWSAGPVHQLSFRTNFADYRSENDGLQFGSIRARTYGSVFKDRSLSMVGEWTSLPGTGTDNTMRIQYGWETRPRVGNSFMPRSTVTVDGTRQLEWGGNPNTFMNDPKEEKLQIVNNLVHRRGDHTFKFGTNNLVTRTRNTFWVNGPGQYQFSSLQAFENQQPQSFLRLVPESGTTSPSTEFSVLELSLYAQDEWRVSERLRLGLGLRYDVTYYLDDFRSVARVDALPGLPADFRSGASPRDFNNISPRLSATFDPAGDGRALFRAGMGRFIGRIPGVIASNAGVGHDPWLAVFCPAATAPPIDYVGWESADRYGGTLPTRCASGADPTGARQYNFWAEDFEYPETWKANVGAERRLGVGGSLGIDLVYGRTTKNFNAIDLALRPDPVFLLTSEGGRPVLVSPAVYGPQSNAAAAARSRWIGEGVDNLFVNVSNGVAEEWATTLRADHQWGAGHIRASYTYNWARDNASAVCCGRMIHDDMIAGHTNERGGRGGQEWGNTNFVRPHSAVLSGGAPLPLGIRLSGIVQVSSGTFFTPRVTGDINGDGANNDRPFIGEAGSMLFDRPEDRDAWEQVLAREACLSVARGTIIARNTCRNPMISQVDLSLRRRIDTRVGGDAEIVVDLFNVLNALNDQWGQLRTVGQTTLLQARGWDAESGRIRYRVNERFGEESFVGPTRQFQVQLGVKMHF